MPENLAPIPVGQPLVVRGEVSDKFVRRGRGYVLYWLEASCEGVVVQRHWKSWAFGLTPEEAAQFPEKPSEPREELADPALETIGPLSYEVTLERMAEFEGPGERNAHTDPALAREGGRPLAQGAISFGLLSRLLTEHFGRGYLVGGAVDVRFIARTYAGERLFAWSELVRGENETALLRVWAEKADGTRLTVGTARARVV